jgi:beta-lactamase regulating signal transducer with metallopeptidase domain
MWPPLWLEEVVPRTLATVALSAAGVFASAAVACRLWRAVRWQRALWQAAVMAMLALAALELTGFADAARHTWVGLVGGPEDSLGEPQSAANPRPKLPADSPSPDSEFFDTGAIRPDDSLWLESESPRSPNDQGLVEAPALASKVVPVPAAPLERLSYSPPAKAAARAMVPAGSALLSALLPAIWLAGALLVLGRSIIGRALLWRFACRLRAVTSERLRQTASCLARQVGLARPFRLCEAHDLAGPMAFGILRPTLVLPRGFSQFDESQQRAMLAHELAHLAGHDPAWQLWTDGLVILLWWHPLAWWARQRLAAANELRADEASLLVNDGPRLLAQCLVALGREQLRPQLGYVGIGGSGFRSNLGRRVARLMTLQGGNWVPLGPRSRAVRAVVIAAVIGAVLVGTSRFQWFLSQPGDSSMNLWRSCWQHSLAGVTLLALLGGTTARADDTSPGTSAVVAFPDDEGEKAQDPKREEGERDGGEGERKEGDRPREGGEGERPRDGERPRGERPRDGERPRGEGPRNGDRPRGEGPREGEPRPVPPRFAEIEREIQELLEAGRKEDAERLKKELDEMKARFARGLGEAGRRVPAAMAEGARRLRHLMAAAENLHAAGMADRAAELMKAAEDLRRELEQAGFRPDAPPGREGGERGEFRPRPPGIPEPAAGRGFGPAGGPPAELMEVLQQLQRQVRELSAQVDDLRAQVRRLSGERGEGREPDRR